VTFNLGHCNIYAYTCPERVCKQLKYLNGTTAVEGGPAIFGLNSGTN